jgi:hypothetical protein
LSKIHKAGVGKNRVYQLEDTISAENIAVLVQTKLQKSSAPFRPFFDKSAKNWAPDFPGPTQFFRPLLCFAAEISASWQH